MLTARLRTLATIQRNRVVVGQPGAGRWVLASGPLCRSGDQVIREDPSAARRQTFLSRRLHLGANLFNTQPMTRLHAAATEVVALLLERELRQLQPRRRGTVGGRGVEKS